MTIQNLPAVRTTTTITPATDQTDQKPTTYRLANPWNKPFAAACALFLAATAGGIALVAVTEQHIQATAGVIGGAAVLVFATSEMHRRFDRNARSRADFKPLTCTNKDHQR